MDGIRVELISLREVPLEERVQAISAVLRTYRGTEPEPVIAAAFHPSDARYPVTASLVEAKRREWERRTAA